MRYTVTWHPSAIDELAEIWLRAADRAAVTEAAVAVDGLLGADPKGRGEEFYGDWLLIASPLAVTFAVSDADRIVQILQVRYL